MDHNIIRIIKKRGFYITNEISNQHTMDFHLHDFFEIFLCVSGGHHFLIDDCIYEMKRGSLFLINNTETHKTTTVTDISYERYYIYFDPEFVLPYCTYQSNLLVSFTNRSPIFDHHFPLTSMQYNQLLILFHRLLKVPSGFGKDILERNYFIEILVYISQLYMEQSTGSTHIINKEYTDIVKPLLDYISTHLNKSITLPQLATQSHFSVVYISKLFKQYTGTTIQKYIIARRITQAKALLKKGENVTSVCHQVGFNDYSHFIRTFKQMVGTPPLKYAKSTRTDE